MPKCFAETLYTNEVKSIISSSVLYLLIRSAVVKAVSRLFSMAFIGQYIDMKKKNMGLIDGMMLILMTTGENLSF